MSPVGGFVSIKPSSQLTWGFMLFDGGLWGLKGFMGFLHVIDFHSVFIGLVGFYSFLKRLYVEVLRRSGRDNAGPIA